MVTINKLLNPKYSDKMAAFDYDWTIVNPKGGKTFPLIVDDWEWYSSNVKNIIRDYYNNGFMIVIFTNQSKKWKYKQINKVCRLLCVPIYIVIANSKQYYKPNIDLFTEFIGEHKINTKESFFVGDAIGRKTDYSDSDKVFAENIGIQYYSPETIFLSKIKFNIPTINVCSNSIIILVGYPGSGKTTLAESICNTGDYIHINSDEFKSNTNKMIQYASKHMNNNQSIIFDATNSSIKKRNMYINLSNKHNFKTVCIHLTTQLSTCFKYNKLREKSIPKIAYSVYNKYFEEPTESEGFKLYTIDILKI